MFSRPDVCPSRGGSRWDRPPPPPPVPAPAPRRFRHSAAPSQSPGRSARLPGSTLRVSATASPCVAHILLLLRHRRRRRRTEPRPPSCAACRPGRAPCLPIGRRPLRPPTRRAPIGPRARAQTGGSTLLFLIGSRRRPPSALDSCRPLIEEDPAAGSGVRSGGSGPATILGWGSGCGPGWMLRDQVGLGCRPVGAELSRLPLFWTQHPPKTPRGSPRPGPLLVAVRDSEVSRDPAGQAGRRRQGFEGFFLFIFFTVTWAGEPAFAECLQRLRRLLATRDRMAPQPGRPLLEPRATRARCARADNAAGGSALGRAHIRVPS